MLRRVSYHAKHGLQEAFSIVLARAEALLETTVLDLPVVCATVRPFVAVSRRARFRLPGAAAPGPWPTPEVAFDVVLMSCLSFQ